MLHTIIILTLSSITNQVKVKTDHAIRKKIVILTQKKKIYFQWTKNAAKHKSSVFILPRSRPSETKKQESK